MYSGRLSYVGDSVGSQRQFIDSSELPFPDTSETVSFMDAFIFNNPLDGEQTNLEDLSGLSELGHFGLDIQTPFQVPDLGGRASNPFCSTAAHTASEQLPSSTGSAIIATEPNLEYPPFLANHL